MGRAFIAFLIWGCPGAILKQFHAHPILLALSRYLFAGLLLNLAGLLFTRAPAGIRQPVPWANRDLWISGAIMLVRNIFYMLSLATGPAVIGGMVYSYVPLLVPLVAQLTGLGRRDAMTSYQWIALGIGFVGNYLIFRGLYSGSAPIGVSVLFGVGAAACYLLTPIYSAKLQNSGFSSWGLLKSQTAITVVLALPFAAVLWRFGFMDTLEAAQVERSLSLGLMIAVFFTILPFYLWYSAIQRAGIEAISLAGFAEPLTTILLSLFVLQDAQANPVVLTGIAVLMSGIAFGVAMRKRPPLRLVNPKRAWVLVHNARFLRVIGLNAVGMPLVYPPLIAVLHGGAWSRVPLFYMNPGFVAVSLVGLFITWSLWNYRGWARAAFASYSVVMAVLSFALLKGDGASAMTSAASAAILLLPSAVLFFRLRREKRRHLNLSADVIHCIDKRAFSATLVDLSTSGCRIRLEGEISAQFVKGTEVEIGFWIEGDRFELGGRVVRETGSFNEANRVEIGVAFRFEKKSQWLEFIRAVTPTLQDRRKSKSRVATLPAEKKKAA